MAIQKQQLSNRKEMLARIAQALARISQKSENPMSEESISGLLGRCLDNLSDNDADCLMTLSELAIDYAFSNHHPEVTEVRPQTLECDVVRFQNNKEKWVALVGLLDGRPYEIFTGLQDDDEGIVLPKTVTSGKSSTPSTGTMPSSSAVCSATVCPLTTSSSSWPRCSCRARTSTPGRLAWSEP